MGRGGSRCWAQDATINVRNSTNLFSSPQHVCIYVCDAERTENNHVVRFAGWLGWWLAGWIP